MLTNEGANKSLPVWQFWFTILCVVVSASLIVGAANNRLSNVEIRQDKIDTMLTKVNDGINDLRERAARIEANQDKRQ